MQISLKPNFLKLWEKLLIVNRLLTKFGKNYGVILIKDEGLWQYSR